VGSGIPASRGQWDSIHSVGSSLRSSLSNVTAVFSPACIAHEVLTRSDWTNVAVRDVSLPDALDCWVSSLPTSDKKRTVSTSAAAEVRARLIAGSPLLAKNNVNNNGLATPIVSGHFHRYSLIEWLRYHFVKQL